MKETVRHFSLSLFRSVYLLIAIIYLALLGDPGDDVISGGGGRLVQYRPTPVILKAELSMFFFSHDKKG